MSSTELQLWMLAVAGIALALFVIGFRWQARSAVSRWALALLAAAGCAVAPAVTRWLDIEGVGERPDLGHSLLVAIAIVAAIALLALLSGTSSRSQHRPGRVPEAADGLVHLSIDADARSTLADTEGQAASAAVVSPSGDSVHPAPRGVDATHGRDRASAELEGPSESLAASATQTATAASALVTPEGEHGASATDRPDASDAPRGVPDTETGPAALREPGHIRGRSAAATGTSAPESDALDLTETQRLFHELRGQDREIELPTDAPWLSAGPPDLVDASMAPDVGELIQAERHDESRRDAASMSAETVDIQLLDDAGDRPTGIEPDVSQAGGEPDPHAADADADADAGAGAGAGAGDSDGARAVELDAIDLEDEPHGAQPDRSTTTESSRALLVASREAARRIEQAERLADSEREARKAAQALAEERAAVTEHLRAEIERLGTRADELTASLSDRERELERAQSNARNAARLAREAANGRLELERSLEEMRVAKARQQRATDRAVAIARNAIAALPSTSAATPDLSATSRSTTPDAGPAFDPPDDGEPAADTPTSENANENASHLDPYDR